jgi:hypothetical protein
MSLYVETFIKPLLRKYEAEQIERDKQIEKDKKRYART